MLLTFSSQIESADGERRIIAGKIVPYEEVGNTSVGKVVFAKDSIEIGDPGKVKMLMQHKNDKPIGRMQKFNKAEDGIYASFKISASMQGQDALIRVEVDLNEACFGTERDITLENAVVCTKCEGTGCVENTQPVVCQVCRGRGETQQVQRSFIGQVMTSRPCSACSGYGSVIENPCRECAGDGRVRARQNINVKIPAGVETGNRIQLSGRGEVGAGGGPAGDLYVEIVETAHEFLLRDGDTLHIAIEISFAAASLGTNVSIETLDGPMDLAIKAGTQSGTTTPIKGKGMTRLRSNTRGDLIVHVDVHTPVKLNKEQEELLNKFASSRGEKSGEVKIKGQEQGFFSKFRDAFSR